MNIFYNLNSRLCGSDSLLTLLRDFICQIRTGMCPSTARKNLGSRVDDLRFPYVLLANLWVLIDSLFIPY